MGSLSHRFQRLGVDHRDFSRPGGDNQCIAVRGVVDGSDVRCVVAIADLMVTHRKSSFGDQRLASSAGQHFPCIPQPHEAVISGCRQPRTIGRPRQRAVFAVTRVDGASILAGIQLGHLKAAFDQRIGNAIARGRKEPSVGVVRQSDAGLPRDEPAGAFQIPAEQGSVRPGRVEERVVGTETKAIGVGVALMKRLEHEAGL